MTINYNSDDHVSNQRPLSPRRGRKAAQGFGKRETVIIRTDMPKQFKPTDVICRPMKDGSLQIGCSEHIARQFNALFDEFMNERVEPCKMAAQLCGFVLEDDGDYVDLVTKEIENEYGYTTSTYYRMKKTASIEDCFSFVHEYADEVVKAIFAQAMLWVAAYETPVRFTDHAGNVPSEEVC